MRALLARVVNEVSGGFEGRRPGTKSCGFFVCLLVSGCSDFSAPGLRNPWTIPAVESGNRVDGIGT